MGQRENSKITAVKTSIGGGIKIVDDDWMRE